MRRLVLVSLAFLALGRAAVAADYPAVSDVLSRLASQAAAAKTPPDTPAVRLRADLKAFAASSAQLAPAEAAAQWLALFDRQEPLQGDDGWSGDSVPKAVSPRELLQALPGPPQWPALAAAIAQRPAKDGLAARRELALQILAGVLTSDRAALKALAAKLDSSTLEAPRRSRFARSYYGNDDQSEVLEVLTGEPASGHRLQDFERQLEQPVQLGLRVPDLVELAGPARAEELLTVALTKGFQNLSFEPNGRTWEQNGKTAELARKVALRELDKLKAPVWELVDAQSLDLYEALAKKFPESKPKPRGWFSRLMGTEGDDEGTQWAHNRAKSNYLAGLILAARFDDAKAFVAQQPSTPDAVSPDLDLADLEKSGRLGDVGSFFRELVEADPKSDYWTLYVDCADRLGQTADAVPVLRAALDREGLSAEQQGELRRLLKRSLLALGQVDEAVVVLRSLRDAPPTKAELDYYDGTPTSLLELATLGKLLDRPEFFEEGLRFAREELDKPRDNSTDRSNAESLAALLVSLGRGPEAAELLVDQLGRTLAASTDDEDGRSYRVRSLLIELLAVYHDAGRHADVVALFDQAPDWGAGDLLELHAESDDRGRPLPLLAASSLAATGRRDVAGKLLQDVLNRQPGYDPAYKLLVELAGTPEQALAQLDARFALDAFEERPLIWKADVLRSAGRLAEAAATARQAIAIDPSDGEQPRGDRMRVYAVLADILAAQGKRQEAEIYRGAVQAVRLAEQADQWFAAGLRGRALELYRQALELFQDAYCIQSRLALHLAEIGDLNGAALHFRKAFELMPDSFGRVESHCFGCEGAFRGALAESIAEEVFNRLAETRSDKPQVLYLQAYLRQSQGREAEAVAPLQAAVRLDPDYLNAWKELHELSEDAPLSPEEREAAVLNLVRLDPGMRHSRYSLRQVRDLAGLWNAMSAGADRLPKPPAALYELAAGKVKQAQQPRENAGEIDVSYDNGEASTPGEALLQTAGLSVVERVLEAR